MNEELRGDEMHQMQKDERAEKASSRLWVSLKRDKVHADIYYKGVKICTVGVNSANRGNSCIINLDADSDVKFKIIKTSADNQEDSEINFNKEQYNK